MHRDHKEMIIRATAAGKFSVSGGISRGDNLSRSMVESAFCGCDGSLNLAKASNVRSSSYRIQWFKSLCVNWNFWSSCLTGLTLTSRLAGFSFRTGSSNDSAWTGRANSRGRRGLSSIAFLFLLPAAFGVPALDLKASFEGDNGCISSLSKPSP